MSQRELGVEETLPLELKLRVLQAELDRVESDYRWLTQRRQELQEQISHCEQRISQTRRRHVIRRVK